MRGTEVRELLELGLNPYERRLAARQIDALATGFRPWRRTSAASPKTGTGPLGAGVLSPLSDVAERADGGALAELLGFLYFEIDREAQHLARMRKRYAEFNQ